jgi:hypothetical protein
MIVCGVDVGLQGGLSIIEDGELVAVFDMPVNPVPYKGKTRNEIDAVEICNILETFRPNIIAIESVSARPGNGGTSLFRFGYASGVVYGAASSFWRDSQTVFVRPQAWKRYWNLIGTSKDEARILCLEKFPSMKDKFKLKKSSGIADASLIALYADYNQAFSQRQENKV